MTSANDIALITQVVVFKNKRAFDQLVQKYQSPIRRFLLNLTAGDWETTNDLAQETFIKAYTNLKNFRNLSGFSTWLFRIAYNVFYDYIREKKEVSALDIKKIDVAYAVEPGNIAHSIDLNASFRVLNAKERSCILLFYMEDLSLEKIAAVIDCPVATVKSHLLRAKEKLSVYLKQNGYDGYRG